MSLWVAVALTLVTGAQYVLDGSRATPGGRRSVTPPPASRARTDLRPGCGPAEEDVMRCEVVAVGTELLLGQIVDTNSAWIGEQLALAGIDCTTSQTVGDNLDRIVDALRLAPGAGPTR